MKSDQTDQDERVVQVWPGYSYWPRKGEIVVSIKCVLRSGEAVTLVTIKTQPREKENQS